MNKLLYQLRLNVSNFTLTCVKVPKKVKFIKFVEVEFSVSKLATICIKRNIKDWCNEMGSNYFNLWRGEIKERETNQISALGEMKNIWLTVWEKIFISVVVESEHMFGIIFHLIKFIIICSRAVVRHACQLGFYQDKDFLSLNCEIFSIDRNLWF